MKSNGTEKAMEDMTGKRMNAGKQDETGRQNRHPTIRQAGPQTAGEVKNLLSAGHVVVIPTDTVYGIIADPRSQVGVGRIFEAKSRPRTKSVQILCADAPQAQKLGLIFPQIYQDLLAEFPKGAVCLVCPVKDDCRLVTTRQEKGYRSQAVRFPAGRQARAIIDFVGPVAASSANRSGDKSATTVQEAMAELGGSVPLYLDGGATSGPVASTVVSLDPASMAQALSGEEPLNPQLKVLRRGVVPESSLNAWALSRVRGLGGENRLPSGRLPPGPPAPTVPPIPTAPPIPPRPVKSGR